MHFDPAEVYHVYNRGNNRCRIFFNHDNYMLFLRKVSSEWLPYVDILAYNLMPNHFHFILVPNELACEYIRIRDKDSHLQNFSKVIGKTLSSYATLINEQICKTGTLFQKKTKAKCLSENSFIVSSPTKFQDYFLRCFSYVHNNPLDAYLVNDLNEWPYSSWHTYYNGKPDGICNVSLFMKLSGLNEYEFKGFLSRCI